MELLETYLKMSPSERDDRFVRTGVAAQLVGVSRRTIQAWVQYGHIEAIKIGHHYRVDLLSLQEYLRNTVAS